VAAAAHRDLEIELMGELDGRHDVGHAAAARDQSRALVDQAVMDAPRRLIAIISGASSSRRSNNAGAGMATILLD
jgi:hypothetical protein